MKETYYIDTHAHIYLLDDIGQKVEDIINKANLLGVKQILMPNIDKESISGMFALADKYSNTCFPMLGLHPVDVKENWELELEEIFSYYSEGCVGIGEIGLDLYWDKSSLNRQILAFKRQIEFAIEREKPISVHVRDAFPEAIAVLNNYKSLGLTGVMHCFTGDYRQAMQAIDMGFLLGIGGVVTFKNAGLDKVVKDIDLKHLILETDSPYLAPVPHRGKKNRPKYIPIIAQKLAEIKGVSVESVATQTTANAKKLFRLP